MKTKDLVTEAISLPTEESAMVVDSLLRNLNSPEPEIDKKWVALANHRLEELRSGRVKTVPVEELLKRIGRDTHKTSYSFHPDAELEFGEAIEYCQKIEFQEIELDLGYDFADEVYSTIKRIVAFPKAWPVLEVGIRQSLVSRFPYGVLYSEENKGIYIVALMHLHRNPKYRQDKPSCTNPILAMS